MRADIISALHIVQTLLNPPVLRRKFCLENVRPYLSFLLPSEIEVSISCKFLAPHQSEASRQVSIGWKQLLLF